MAHIQDRGKQHERRWQARYLCDGCERHPGGGEHTKSCLCRPRHNHDLRHFFASLLIASGADVKVVQHRMRHSAASTTLNTYAELWPDQDESTRAAVEKVMSEKMRDAIASP